MLPNIHNTIPTRNEVGVQMNAFSHIISVPLGKMGNANTLLLWNPTVFVVNLSHRKAARGFRISRIYYEKAWWLPILTKHDR